MVPPENLWIPVTIFAAFAQTIRNATQKHLTASLGTLGATLVRFLYGLPFAAAWLLAVGYVGEFNYPAPNWKFGGWIFVGAIGQIGATALLLRVLTERNFTLGVAYSKTETLQVAFFGFLFLGDPILPAVGVAVIIGTLGVILMSPINPDRPLRALISGWTSRVALYGLACGTCFSVAVIGYRGGALALEGAPYPMAAAYSLVAAQLMQTLILGAWIGIRNYQTIVEVFRAWRTSLIVGFFGAAASIAWFIAMTIEPVAHVRTLALVELLFAYFVSRRIFRERLMRTEMLGIALLAVGVATVTLGR